MNPLILHLDPWTRIVHYYLSQHQRLIYYPMMVHLVVEVLEGEDGPSGTYYSVGEITLIRYTTTLHYTTTAMFVSFN